MSDITGIFKYLFLGYNSDRVLSIIALSANLMSVFANILLLFILKKHSLFSKIFRKSVYAEGFMHFCMSSIFYNSLFSGHPEKVDNFFEKIGYFNVLKYIFQPQKFYFLCVTINSALFFTTFLYTTLMHVFIFLELTLMLMNPISSATFRTNIYYIVSGVCSAITFFLHVNDDYLKSFDLKDISEQNPNTTIIIFSLFLVMIVLSIVHLVYSFKRLGKKFMKQGLYMKFLIKQLVMSITYFSCFAPFQIVMFCQALKKNDIFPEWLDEAALILFSLLGFIQFFFRVSDTNFYNVIWRCIKKNLCFLKKNNTNDSSIDEKSKDGVSNKL
jgi:hypothetical protein